MKLSERFDRRYQQTPLAMPVVPGAAPSANGPPPVAAPAAPAARPPQVVMVPATPVPAALVTESSAKLTPSLAAAKAEIHAQLLAHHTAQIDINNPAGIRRLLLQLTEEHFRTKPPATLVTATDKERLVEVLFDEVVGLGQAGLLDGDLLPQGADEEVILVLGAHFSLVRYAEEVQLIVGWSYWIGHER